MFRKLAQKFYVFMMGRNGPDDLFRLCSWSAVAVALISVFVRNLWLGLFLSAIYYGLLAYSFFRLLSKNVYKRRRENDKYVAFKNKIKSFFKRKKAQFRDRKTHVYKKCPHCKVTLRLPKQKGKHTVSCPKCRKSFETKI